MKRKFLLIIMALLPMVVSADDSGTCSYDGSVTWKYVESTHTLTISGKGEMKRYSDENSDDVPMITERPWANYYENIQNVIIESGVTSVGSAAFLNCTNLVSVSIPNTVTRIGWNAFEKCSSLASIVIPNQVSYIGVGAFINCVSLQSITIPMSVTEIGCSDTKYFGDDNNNIFRGCSSLTSIKVEAGNTVYDSREDCNAVIRTSTNHMLAGCKNSTIPNSVTAIGSVFDATSITTLTIPDNVKSIARSAFSGCKYLTSLTLGSGVLSIGSYFIYQCESLTDLTCLAVSVPSASSSMGPKENITLHVPEQSIEAYKSAWPGFKAYVPIVDPNAQKCATPTFKVENGLLKFECSTKGVKFNYSISTESGFSGISEDNNTSGGIKVPKIIISVYATKSGYQASDVAKKEYTVELLGDLNGDGDVNVADHVKLSEIILGKTK